MPGLPTPMLSIPYRHCANCLSSVCIVSKKNLRSGNKVTLPLSFRSPCLWREFLTNELGAGERRGLEAHLRWELGV